MKIEIKCYIIVEGVYVRRAYNLPRGTAFLNRQIGQLKRHLNFRTGLVPLIISNT